MNEEFDKKAYEESVEMEIIQVLDRIRPFIQRDGGDLRLVKYEDGCCQDEARKKESRQSPSDRLWKVE